MGEPFLCIQGKKAEQEGGGKGNSLKDMGRENDTRAEHKTSNGSPGSLETNPICPDVGDTITLSLETIYAPARETLLDDSLALRALG